MSARVWPLVFSGNLSPSTAANSQLSCAREIYEPSIYATEKLRDTTGATVSAGGLGGREKHAAVAKSLGVSRCLETSNATKRKKGSCANERFEPPSGRRESRKVDSERIHTRKFVKGPFY